MQLYKTNEYIFKKPENIKKIENTQILYIAIPVLAFKVSFVEHNNPENIIETTVIKLKKIGHSVAQIANELCLEKIVVENILDYYKYNESTYDSSDNIQATTFKTGYMFYDCFNERYFDMCMEAKDFVKSTDLYIAQSNKYSVNVKFNINESKTYNVKLLQKNNLENNISIIPSQEQIISNFNELNKTNSISSKYYSNGQYLNEYKEMKLVCACYFDRQECIDFSILHPVNGKDPSKTLYFLLKENLEKYKKENYFILKALNDMKNNCYEILENTVSDNKLKPFSELVKKKYGKAITKFRDIFDKLVYLEYSYTEYCEKIKQGIAFVEIHEELSKFQINLHTVLEEIFITSFKNNIDEKTKSKIGRISKSNTKKELLWAYIKKLGFEAENKEIYDFLKGINTGDIEYAFYNMDCSNKRINLWFIANVICGTVNHDHPICDLARKLPKIIPLLKHTKEMRDSSKHGGKIKEISNEECDELYNFCHRTLKIMLKIEELNNIETKMEIQSNNMDLLVNRDLEKLKTNDENIIKSAKEMVESYHKKEYDFYSKCSNFLVSIYLYHINILFNDDKRNDAVKLLTEDKECNRKHINKILSCNNIKYEIKSVVAKNKICIDYDDIEKITMNASMYLFVILTEEEDPDLFGKLEYLETLLELTDEISDLRGHSRTADFQKDSENISKLYNKLIKIITQFRE